MKGVDYLLIGGGVASNEAAKKLRDANPESRIVIVSKEPYPPYNRTMLSKDFLEGKAARESLFLDPMEFYEKRKIEVMLGTSVDGLDAKGKSAVLSSGEELPFAKALIATGGEAIRVKLPGADQTGVHYLRTLDDAAIMSQDALEAGSAVIIGAGFIGLEVAVALTKLGVGVDVVEMMPHIWARFTDAKLAGFFQDYCNKKGVRFHTGEKVTEIKGNGKASAVAMESGKELACDFVCIGVGIRPSTQLADDAGLEVENGIMVNSYMETSCPDIFAAGDVASYPDVLFGKRRRVEHWAHARFSGRLAGENMSGARKEYDLLSHVWADIFDLHLEFAGDESEHDETLIRGRFEDESFTVLYLKESVAKAYFAINTDPKEIMQLNRLLESQSDLTGSEDKIADTSFDIRQLVE